MSKKPNKMPPVLEDPQGYTDDNGHYVPTPEELRARFPEKLKDRDLSRDNYRRQVWRHPPTLNLIPITDPADARAKQLKGVQTKKNRLAEFKHDKKHHSAFLDILRDELKEAKGEDIDPYQLLQLRVKMAVLENDWDKVESLAITMVEFTKPKLQRVEQNTKHTGMGKASVEDIEAFVTGTLSYEDFIKKTKDD